VVQKKLYKKNLRLQFIALALTMAKLRTDRQRPFPPLNHLMVERRKRNRWPTVSFGAEFDKGCTNRNGAPTASSAGTCDGILQKDTIAALTSRQRGRPKLWQKEIRRQRWRQKEELFRMVNVMQRKG
jgi:hypothetical protein